MKKTLVIGSVCVGLIMGMVGMSMADPIVNVGKVRYEDRETGGKVTIRESEPAVINGPYLTVTKTANKKNIEPGEEVEYTITVKNVGTKDAYNVLISDKFPDELKLIDCKVIIYDEKGNIVEELEINKDEMAKQQERIQERISEIKEGEIIIKKEMVEQQKNREAIDKERNLCSIIVRKGSTTKEALIKRFGPAYVAAFFQKGRL